MIRLLACLIFLAAPAFALNVDETLPNAAAEQRAQQLFRELRCVVCEGESIADSPAEVARDMRRGVRKAIIEGDSDENIKAELVQQYGERVLMRPNASEHRLLWAAPLLLLLAGAFFAWRHLFKGAPE
jgi:cytochrome c-type biogenesis protein CcmH